MLRRIRSILCGLSLLLFLTLLISWPFARRKPVGLWYKQTDTVYNLWYKNTDRIYNSSLNIKTPHFYFVTLDGNEFSIGHWRHPEIFSMHLVSQFRFKMNLGEMRANQLEEQLKLGTTPEILRKMLENVEALIAAEEAHGFLKPDGLHTGPNPLYPWPPLPSAPTAFAGLSYQHQEDPSMAILVHRVTLPMWLPLTLLAIAPAVRGYRLLLRYDRRRAGRCPTCGYDLRATPALCPECGHAATITPDSKRPELSHCPIPP